MPLGPLGPKRVGRDVHGNPEVVPRKPNVLDAVAEALAQQPQLQKTDVVEGHGVARGAVVEHDAVLGVAGASLPKRHNLLNLVLRRHARRDVHVARVLVAQHALHLPVLVRRRADLDQLGVDGDHLLGRRRVPHAARVDEVDALAVLLQLGVLRDAHLEELAVRAVRRTVRVVRVWVGRLVLFFRQQFLGRALLELAHRGARELGEREELLCDLKVAHVVAANLRDDARFREHEVVLEHGHREEEAKT
mmetsp:Transcript_31189/g.107772  ORF Transcript_31189/g.107772 Transcript_31189/m.107772 type:complete len:248 (-) Transcript_31189:56-799(-)